MSLLNSIKGFIDDIIPNEIKKNDAAKAILLGTAFGASYFKPQIKDVYETVTGGDGLSGIFRQYNKKGEIEKAGFLGRYFGDTSKITKFARGVSTAVGALDKSETSKDTYLTNIQSAGYSAKVPVGKYGSYNVGAFRAQETPSVGFNNRTIQTALTNVAQYYDSVARGTIPTSAYTVEGPRGTKVRL